MSEKTFVASYSGGKDSVLAIHRALRQGMTLQALLITCNPAQNRSWFHGIPGPVLDEVARSVGVPVVRIETAGPDYADRFEETLRGQKALGATACVFGDIDLDEHLAWCTARCEAAGMTALFPLWKQSRRALVFECIAQGFTPRLTVVDTTRLDEAFLGRTLTRALAEEIAATGADICGENGEYHTFVTDGPIFSHPIPVSFDPPHREGGHVFLPLSQAGIAP